MTARLLFAIGLLSVATNAAPAQTAAKPNPAWRIVYERGGDLWTMGADGKNAHRLIARAAQPALLFNRSKIAFVRRDNVFVAGADGSRVRQVTHWRNGAIHGVSWHPSGVSLVVSHIETFTGRSESGKPFVAETATLYTVSLAGNAPPIPLYGFRDFGTGFGFTHYEYPAWAPDGVHLAFAVNGDLWMATNNGVRTDENNKPIPGAFEWDATRVAPAANYDAPNYRGSRANVGVTGISWSPDAKRLAYCRTRLGGTGIAEVRLLTFAPGDKTVATKDERVFGAGIALFDATDEMFAPCFSPDGAFLLLWSVREPRGLFAAPLTNAERRPRVFYPMPEFTTAVW